MKLPRRIRVWMQSLTVLFVIATITSYIGVVIAPVWYLITLPASFFFVIITLGVILKFVVPDERLVNLKALNGLYQMEIEEDD